MTKILYWKIFTAMQPYQPLHGKLPVKKQTIFQFKFLITVILIIYAFMSILNKYDAINAVNKVRLPKPASNLKAEIRQDSCQQILQLENKKSSSNISVSQRTIDILAEIFYSKQDKSFLYYEYYAALASLVPSIVINSTKENETILSVTEVSSYITIDNLDFNYGSIIYFALKLISLRKLIKEVKRFLCLSLKRNLL